MSDFVSPTAQEARRLQRPLTRVECEAVKAEYAAWAGKEITRLQSEVERLRGREVDLLTICQAVQRDLLLRAEPDWDGSGRNVVNLSAGFWDELNRVIGKYDDTACKSFDAAILIKQAEAVEALASARFVYGTKERLAAMDYAQRLRQQAAESEDETS